VAVPNYDEDKTPSDDNHIYHTDAPRIQTPIRDLNWDFIATIGDFKEWVIVEIDGSPYQCSDYYKWHSKIYTEPEDPNDPNNLDMTRSEWELQQLGSAWITVPDSP
jgi:hypothetical protein